jgi:putative membrane protein
LRGPATRADPHNQGVMAAVRRWFDPQEVRDVGVAPDYRFSLANERTFLAWIRTGLALIGGGLAVAGFLPELHLPHLREILAAALMLLGAAVTVRAVDHWARSEIAMRLNQPLPPSRFPAILALIVAVGAILLILGAILPGHK